MIKERPQTIHIARDPNAARCGSHLFWRHITGGTAMCSCSSSQFGEPGRNRLPAQWSVR